MNFFELRESNEIDRLFDILTESDAFDKTQLDKLKKGYEKIETIKPGSPTYDKLKKYIDGLTDDQLKSLKGAKIKWLSVLANSVLMRRNVKEEVELEESINPVIQKEKELQTESLNVSDGIKAWIDDFIKSDAPQFNGKSDKERRDMAIAAYMSAKNQKNEAFEASYNDVIDSEDDEVSNYILARRRNMRRTDTTGGNNNEY